MAESITPRLVITKEGQRCVVQADEGFDWAFFARYLRDQLDNNPGLALTYLTGGGGEERALKSLLTGG